MRIVFVSPYVPSPIRVRPFYWIKHLAARGHEIELFAIADGAADGAALDAIRPYCARVETAALVRWRAMWNCARALFTADPLQLAWSRLPRLARAIQAAVGERHGVAHVEHLRGACFAPALVPLPVVYDAVDSISLLFDQTRALGPRLSDRGLAALDVNRTRRFEASMLRRFHGVLVSSPIDAKQILTLSGSPESAARLTVLPNAVDLDYFRPSEAVRDQATLIFSGKMSYHANIAAAQFLASEILPLVWRARADVRLVIAGLAPDASVRRLASDPRISVTGYVADLRPLLARATLAVCPLPYGVGIQNKVLEALASGLPVVASRRAVHALSANAGDLTVADSAQEFASEILRLLEDPATRATLATNGRAYVEQHHAGGALVSRLESAYLAADRYSSSISSR